MQTTRAKTMTTTIMAIPLRFPYFLASNLAALHHTRRATMNSEQKPWRWGKRKEERNSNRFLERNDEDRRKRALVSLLSSSLPLPLHSFVTTTKVVAVIRTSTCWTRSCHGLPQVTSRHQLGHHVRLGFSRHPYTVSVISPSYDVQMR